MTERCYPAGHPLPLRSLCPAVRGGKGARLRPQGFLANADGKRMILLYVCRACGRGVALGTAPGQSFERERSCECGCTAELRQMTTMKGDSLEQPTKPARTRPIERA